MRLRDYLQTVIDTNPGSRCIVTTKMLLEHPSKNPRFHGLFYCLGASIEGFLKGCRPFFGELHGSFIQICSKFLVHLNGRFLTLLLLVLQG
jgi:hypothetical protein